MPDSVSEIRVRFGDEAIETISALIVKNTFLLYGDEAGYDVVKLVRKLTKHGRFRLRCADKGVTLVFKYDIYSAEEAIGEVLEACGYELEPFDWFGLFD